MNVVAVTSTLPSPLAPQSQPAVSSTGSADAPSFAECVAQQMPLATSSAAPSADAVPESSGDADAISQAPAVQTDDASSAASQAAPAVGEQAPAPATPHAAATTHARKPAHTARPHEASQLVTKQGTPETQAQAPSDGMTIPAVLLDAQPRTPLTANATTRAEDGMAAGPAVKDVKSSHASQAPSAGTSKLPADATASSATAAAEPVAGATTAHEKLGSDADQAAASTPAEAPGTSSGALSLSAMSPLLSTNPATVTPPSASDASTHAARTASASGLTADANDSPLANEPWVWQAAQRSRLDVEVGFGAARLQVQATIGAEGSVHAVLLAASDGARAQLASETAPLLAYLATEHVPVSSVEVRGGALMASADGGTQGQAQQRDRPAPSQLSPAAASDRGTLLSAFPTMLPPQLGVAGLGSWVSVRV